jgi:tRNA-modifying protein YgfZ
VEDLQHTPYHFWQPAACLRVTGEDALTFLQGQVTNNLAELIVDHTVYGLLLNQKGKVLADCFVGRVGQEEFLVVSYHSKAEDIRERLEAYIIADDVTITDETDQSRGVTFFTEADHWEVISHLPGGYLFPGRRTSGSHWEWIAPEVQLEEISPSLHQDLQLTNEEMERRRIAAKIPAIPQDIGLGELPNEGGLDRDAISYTKGCYLGQEVMARLKAMGQVRRQLLPLNATAPLPTLPAPLFAGEKQVGELRSAVATPEGFDGLALITLMHVPADRKLALTVSGPSVVTLQNPA